MSEQQTREFQIVVESKYCPKKSIVVPISPRFNTLADAENSLNYLKEEFPKAKIMEGGVVAGR